MGVFVFSPEEGTPAAAMPDQVDREIAERRAELVMELQSAIMDEFNASRVGQTLEVLCEGYDGELEYWYGRSFADSPDIDGRVYFTGGGQLGEFVQVRITDIFDGDLLGESV